MKVEKVELRQATGRTWDFVCSIRQDTLKERRFSMGMYFRRLLPPKTFKPSSSDGSLLAEMVKAERTMLTDTLEKHGAILFRGFGVGSADDFSHVVQAFGWDEFQYQGPADRTKLADRVYTANAVPLDVMISFHHEMAMVKEFPHRIMFHCLQQPPQGGQTSIILSNVVFDELKDKWPQVVSKFEQDGIIFVLHTKRVAFKNDNNTVTSNPTADTVWQRMLKTTDQDEGEKRAKDMLACDSIKFNDDGTAVFTFGPMNPLRKFNGKTVIFNRILGYETRERDAFVTFGDGSPLPFNLIQDIMRIYECNCVDINWHKGDMLLVDNLAVQHARRPGKSPRVVLVSLAK